MVYICSREVESFSPQKRQGKPWKKDDKVSLLLSLETAEQPKACDLMVVICDLCDVVICVM